MCDCMRTMCTTCTSSIVYQVSFFTSWLYLIPLLCLGGNIQKLTDITLEDESAAKILTEKAAMVRAARQLLSAITKVLLLADKVVVKQLVSAKDKVCRVPTACT